MPNISALAKRYGLSLTHDGQAIDLPTGRIIQWGDDDLAYTGTTERKIKRLDGVRSVFRRGEDITLAFAPRHLSDVLEMLAV